MKQNKELTFESIKHNYLKYGYLSDREVEWLIDKVGGFMNILNDNMIPLKNPDDGKAYMGVLFTFEMSQLIKKWANE